MFLSLLFLRLCFNVKVHWNHVWAVKLYCQNFITLLIYLTNFSHSSYFPPHALRTWTPLDVTQRSWVCERKMSKSVEQDLNQTLPHQPPRTKSVQCPTEPLCDYSTSLSWTFTVSEWVGVTMTFLSPRPTRSAQTSPQPNTVLLISEKASHMDDLRLCATCVNERLRMWFSGQCLEFACGKTASDKSFKWKASTSATDLELILKSHRERFTSGRKHTFQSHSGDANVRAGRKHALTDAYSSLGSINKNLKPNLKVQFNWPIRA